jgi:hypothetical protein
LRGKLYRPCESLTTVIAIVEPVLLAVTSTPSMAPSSCELTRPVSPGESELWAFVVVTELQDIANITKIEPQKNRRLVMCLLLFLAKNYPDYANGSNCTKVAGRRWVNLTARLYHSYGGVKAFCLACWLNPKSD